MGYERTKRWRELNPDRHRALQREASRRYRDRCRGRSAIIRAVVSETMAEEVFAA